jgi:sugar/nucleoside kinase (ribokinase family)
MKIPLSVNTLICGRLAQETIINTHKTVFIEKPGGNLLYTAYSYRLWRDAAGLAAKVGENFSEDWITEIQSHHFNTYAIKRLPVDMDVRAFYAFVGEDDFRSDNPQKYFFDLGKPFPKSLLGYTPAPAQLDNRRSGTEWSLRPEDIPGELMDCHFLYMAPLDFLSHSLIPPLFRAKSTSTVIINPAPRYMQASFWFDVPALIQGSTAVITTLNRANKLFLGRDRDMWGMAETLATFGVEIVVITAGADGQYLYERDSRKKYHIPAYPAEIVDTVCASDAFGGGFLAGYTTHFDPLQAALMGNISASIKVEGSTPDYLLHAMSELAQARLENLQSRVQEC